MFLQVVIYQYDYKISVIVLHVLLSFNVKIFLKMLLNDAKSNIKKLKKN
jgi:hypothetical protein